MGKEPYYDSSSIDGFEEYYSQQEIELLDGLKKKLHIGERKKNSQLLSLAQCQDVHETGNSYNHMIACENENASVNLNIACEVEKWKEL